MTQKAFIYDCGELAADQRCGLRCHMVRCLLVGGSGPDFAPATGMHPRLSTWPPADGYHLPFSGHLADGGGMAEHMGIASIVSHCGRPSCRRRGRSCQRSKSCACLGSVLDGSDSTRTMSSHRIREASRVSFRSRSMLVESGISGSVYAHFARRWGRVASRARLPELRRWPSGPSSMRRSCGGSVVRSQEAGGLVGDFYRRRRAVVDRPRRGWSTGRATPHIA